MLLFLVALACTGTIEQPTGHVEPVEVPDVPIQVHISIDDAPWMIQRNFTVADEIAVTKARNEALIAVFAEHEVTASVFFNCSRIRQGDNTVQSWAAAGHTVGNHTWSHAMLRNMSPDEWVADARRCHNLLTDILGKPNKWFRYPYLGYGASESDRDKATAGLASFGERTAPITLATAEWLHGYTYRKAKRIGDVELEKQVVADYHRHLDDALEAGVAAAQIAPGRPVPQTMLIHLNEINIDELSTLLGRWKADGVVFIDLETAMADPVFQMENHFTQWGGVSWLWRIRAEMDYTEYWFNDEEGRVRALFGEIEVPDMGIPIAPAELEP